MRSLESLFLSAASAHFTKVLHNQKEEVASAEVQEEAQEAVKACEPHDRYSP